MFVEQTGAVISDTPATLLALGVDFDQATTVLERPRFTCGFSKTLVNRILQCGGLRWRRKNSSWPGNQGLTVNLIDLA